MTYRDQAKSSKTGRSLKDVSKEIHVDKQRKTDRENDRFICSKSLERSPIKWTFQKMEEIRDFFHGKSYPYRFYDFTPTYKNFGKEIFLFSVSLDAYIEEKGIIKPEDLIYFSSAGPEYTKVLKKFRQDCFLFTIGAFSFKKEKAIRYEDYNLTVQRLSNIDEIFPYRFCIFWEESCDDSAFYDIPLKTDNRVIDEFKTCLGFILSSLQPRQYDPRFEVLTELSTSESLIEEQSRLFIFRPYRGKDISKYFSERISHVKRSIIPVYPGGYRDSIVCSPEDISTIKLIEKITCEILEDIPCHLYLAKPDEIFSSVDKAVRHCRPDTTFICRDIEKEGLTKPRYLLRIMLEELAKLNPVLQPYTQFYESFKIDDHPTFRGHGLGMANALTTLMQCVISMMIKDRLENKGFESDLIEFLVFNDDFLATMPNDFRDEYWEEEGEIFEGLGVIRNETKSFWSMAGAVFCENYSTMAYESFSDKRVSRLRTVYLTFCFDYIYEAKEFLSSLGEDYKSLIEDKFEEIIRFWGYEFFQEEARYPKQFGGWVSYNFGNYNIDFSIFEFEEFNHKVYAAYQACKFHGRIYRKSDEQKHSIFLNYIIPEIEEIKQFLPIGDDNELKNRYKVYQTIPQVGFNFRKFIARRRHEIYEKTLLKNKVSFSIFKSEHFEDKNNILPKSEIEWKVPDVYIQPLGDPYQHKTPLRNYLLSKGLSYFSDASNNLAEEYSILNFRSKVPNQDLGKEFILPNYLTSNEMESVGINRSQFEIDDRQIADLGNVIYAVQRLHNDDFYPVLDQRYRDPDVERRKLQCFGRMLNLEEQIQISTRDMTQAERRFIERFRVWLERARPEGLNDEEADYLIGEIERLANPVTGDVDEEPLPSDEDIEPEEDLEQIKKRSQEELRKVQGPKLKTLDQFLEQNLWRAIFENDDLDDYEQSVKRAVTALKELYDWYYHTSDALLGSKFKYEMTEKVLGRLDETTKANLLLLAEKLILRDGFCKEMSELFGIEVPEEDEDFGDMFGFEW